MCFNQDGPISSLNGKPFKLAVEFIYLGSNISSMDSNVNIHRAWVAVDRLSTIWKSDPSYKINREFFQVVAVSILL